MTNNCFMGMFKTLPTANLFQAAAIPLSGILPA
jgi:hypothetical protein